MRIFAQDDEPAEEKARFGAERRAASEFAQSHLHCRGFPCGQVVIASGNGNPGLGEDTMEAVFDVGDRTVVSALSVSGSWSAGAGSSRERA